MSAEVGERVGGFTLTDRVGEDAWLGLDAAGVEVLVRFVDPGGSARQDGLDAVVAALRRLADVESPYVVPVRDAGVLGDRVWVATAPPGGRDLRAVLDDGGLALPAALDVVRQAALGVAAAAAAGVAHGGLGPACVHLGADGAVRVGGFGVPATGWDVYDYTAPERYAGIPAGPAGDVYSLGGVLWAALTGGPPYDAATPYDVVRAHVDADPPRLSGRLSVSGPAVQRVDAVLARALAKPTAVRHAGAAELAEDLAGALAAVEAAEERLGDVPPQRSGSQPTRPEPVPSWPATPVPARSSPPDRTSRAGRSRRVLPTIAAVVVLVAGVGLFLVLGRDRPPPPAGERPEAADVFCWDGSRAGAGTDCGLPSGRAGLAHVFPSLVDSRDGSPDDSPDDSPAGVCEPAPLRVTGKTEVYVCRYQGYLIRYSAWRPDADRVAYYDEANPGAETGRWRQGGVDLGPRWLSYDERPAVELRHQWSATYADLPYSVSVEGATVEDRTAGLRRLRAARPDEVRVRTP